VEKEGENYRFIDPKSGIYLVASDKNSVANAWFHNGPLEQYAEKINLPFVLLAKGGNHFNLLLKGPKLEPDGKYKILVYDPFHNAEESLEVDIKEDFESLKQRRLNELKSIYNASNGRYEFPNGTYIPESNIDRYLYFHDWLKLPGGIQILNPSELTIQQLLSSQYDLSILNFQKN